MNELLNTESKKKMSFRRLLPLLIIVAGCIPFFALGLGDYLSFEALKANRDVIMTWTAENYPLAVLAFVGAYILVISMSLPGGVWLTVTGGFLFGTLETTSYVVVGATLGATVIFLAARYAFADYLRAKAGASVRKMEDGFRENAMSYLLFLRLVPVFPFWLVNLVPAFIGVPVRTYVVGTFFGIIPGTFVFASVGGGLAAVFDSGGEPDMGIIFTPGVLIPIVGLAVLSLIPVFYKKFTQRNSS
jgi:uncharacterized membrane protein YdjX (TVP38/TMEM64 family)